MYLCKGMDSLIQSNYKQDDQGAYYCAGRPYRPLQNRKAFLLGFVLKQAWLYCTCNRNPPWKEELEEDFLLQCLVEWGEEPVRR